MRKNKKLEALLEPTNFVWGNKIPYHALIYHILYQAFTQDLHIKKPKDETKLAAEILWDKGLIPEPIYSEDQETKEELLCIPIIQGSDRMLRLIDFFFDLHRGEYERDSKYLKL